VAPRRACCSLALLLALTTRWSCCSPRTCCRNRSSCAQASAAQTSCDSFGESWGTPWWESLIQHHRHSSSAWMWAWMWLGSAAAAAAAPAMGDRRRSGKRAPRSTLGPCASALCCPSAGGGANPMGLLGATSLHRLVRGGRGLVAAARIQPLFSPGGGAASHLGTASATRNWTMSSDDSYLALPRSCRTS